MPVRSCAPLYNSTGAKARTIHKWMCERDKKNRSVCYFTFYGLSEHRIPVLGILVENLPYRTFTVH